MTGRVAPAHYCAGACRVHLFVQCPDLGLHRAPVRGVRPLVRQEDRVSSSRLPLVPPPRILSREAAAQSALRVFGPNSAIASRHVQTDGPSPLMG
jgi:hypothetical protein